MSALEKSGASVSGEGGVSATLAAPLDSLKLAKFSHFLFLSLSIFPFSFHS